ncbi:metal-dependent hydrolase [Chloroflexota bacterium]
MFIFGHIGLTVGAATILANSLPRKDSAGTAVQKINKASPFYWFRSNISSFLTYSNSLFATLGHYIDIRLLVIASILPDIIDKPIGIYFFKDTISNGRIICHTLIFLILITTIGLYMYKRHRRTSLLGVSFGVFTHLVFDQMWHSPRTLFWPIYGITFDKGHTTDWITNMLNALVTDPHVYIPELVGAAILFWFTLALVHKKAVFGFIKYGHVY